MNKMLKEMVENYKATIDSHRKDFEKGCYETLEEYRKVLEEEYRTLGDVFYGLSRYGAISNDKSNEIINECLGYALTATIV